MRILLILQIMVLPMLFFAQTPANTNQDLFYKKLKGHAFGLALTSSNGKGVCYRYWPGKNGFHVALFPTSSRNGHYYSVAVSAYRNLYEFENSRLFLQCGIENINRAEIERTYAYDSLFRPSGITSTVTSRRNGLSICFGPGFEFSQKNIAFDVFLGVQGQLVRSNYESLGRWRDVPDGFFMNLSGGVAMFYMF